MNMFEETPARGSRILAYVLSLLLHGAVLFAAVTWESSPPAKPPPKSPPLEIVLALEREESPMPAWEALSTMQKPPAKKAEISPEPSPQTTEPPPAPPPSMENSPPPAPASGLAEASIKQPEPEAPSPNAPAITPQAAAETIAAAPQAASQNSPATTYRPGEQAAFSLRIEPEYPVQARRLRQQGSVTLGLYINPAGQLDKVDIVKSSGYRPLDAAAVAAMRASRFTPARNDGTTVGVRAEITITFRLQ